MFGDISPKLTCDNPTCFSTFLLVVRTSYLVCSLAITHRPNRSVVLYWEMTVQQLIIQTRHGM